MKKAILTITAIIMIFALASCSGKSAATAGQATDATTAAQIQQSTSIPQSNQKYFNSISGMGTNWDFEVGSEIAKLIEDNPIDNNYIKEREEVNNTKDYTIYKDMAVIGKYINIWKAEWDASDKRIQKLLDEKKIKDADYDALKKIYKDNKSNLEKSIKDQIDLHFAIAMQLGGKIDDYCTAEAELNLYRRAAFNSFQIELCLFGSSDDFFSDYKN